MNRTLKILPEGRVIKVPFGRGLSDVLEEAGISLSLYCGGRGLCGKCFVEIVRGDLPEANEDERALRARRNLSPNHRLACRCRVEGDLVVRVPAGSRLPKMPVLSRGAGRTVPLDPAVCKIRLTRPVPDPASPRAFLDSIAGRFSGSRLPASVKTLKDLTRTASVAAEGSEVTAVLYQDRDWIALEPADTTDRNFGIAVDLGTTTVVVELIDLNAGTIVDSAAGLNPQVKFGADVVSRITAAFADPAKLEDLRAAVVGGLNDLIGGLLEANRVAPENVYEAVVAGNTAMGHLFLGLPVATLAVSPYAALFSVLPALPADETGLAIHPGGRVYLAPNIRSFVGGDIAAGLAAIDLEHQDGNFLFIDLGTNGEIVVKKGGRFTTTSTAAGPAFEGMTISCGMLALPGAVYKARYRKGGLSLETIAGQAAKGVCGTGLIDIIAGALDGGLLSPQGHILSPSKTIGLTNGLALSQKDVREVQLAAAAVKTGIRMLLDENSMTTADLDGIYVAGAFGNYLNIPNSVKLGLLPRFDRRRIRFVGNSSLAGARALLLSRPERARCEKLAGKVRHVSLAKGADFQELFIEALEFKAWK
jgi:uncharacterized 2Fe-2S/4Fe-4S cluster protein (DUF4445 family)